MIAFRDDASLSATVVDHCYDAALDPLAADEGILIDETCECPMALESLRGFVRNTCVSGDGNRLRRES